MALTPRRCINLLWFYEARDCGLLSERESLYFQIPGCWSWLSHCLGLGNLFIASLLKSKGDHRVKPERNVGFNECCLICGSQALQALNDFTFKSRVMLVLVV